MTVQRSDVLVVGAGPGGTATALFLARRGYEVTLLDRATFPRDKPCGEYLTPGAVGILRDELGLLPDLLDQGAVVLTREKVIAHNSRSFCGTMQALACPRLVLDDTLRQAAEAAGVRMAQGFAARRMLFQDDAVTGVAGRDAQGRFECYQAGITVGADGTHSLAARTLGLVRPIARLQRVALVGHFRFPAAEAGENAVMMHLPVDRSDACCGVGPACGPDGGRNVNIVVPTSEASQMAGRREAYFRQRLRHSFPQVWEVLEDAAPMSPLRSIGCFGHHTTRATHDGALLVGDAATFINPFTGEGVFFALRGAQMAAEAIDAAFREGDLSRRALQRYDAVRERELLPRYRLCDAVQRIVHSPPLLAWATERLRRSADLTDVLLRTVGDIARPRDLFSCANLRLALGTFSGPRHHYPSR